MPGEVTIPDNWKTTLPTEIQTHTAIGNVKSVADLATQFVNSQKLIGADKIAVPGESATDEDYAAVYTKLGRPEAHDKYKLPDVKLPEGLTLSEDKLTTLRKTAFDAGLSQRQFNKLLTDHLSTVATEFEAAKASRAEARANAENTLKTEFKDNYAANVDIARSVVEQFGGTELKALLEETGIGNNPHMVRMLFKLGNQMMEDVAKGGGKNLLIVKDETSAKKEIAQLRMDETFQKQLTSDSSPMHQAAVERWTELHKKAYPGKQE